MLPNWQNQNNTSDLEQLKAWANEFPGCNWGMLCGEPSGRWVLDFDIKRQGLGLRTYYDWVKRHGREWTLTVRIRTAGDGLHLHYPWSPGIRRSIAAIGKGVDILGAGGFAVIPPSVIDGKMYRFEDSCPMMQLIPDWLLRLVEGVAMRIQRPADPFVDTLRERLDEESIFSEGQRHRQLFDYLFRLRINGATLAVLKFAARDLNQRFVPGYDDYELDRQAEYIWKRYQPSVLRGSES